jgi:ectoine hydroxylase-related dioxygenase (phytanoyl-CoA dioxygenase family)
MISNYQLDFFSANGYLVMSSFDRQDACEQMLKELQNAVDEDSVRCPDVFDAGMVHNCFLRGHQMLAHLSSKYLRQATDALLCKNAIIYAYQSSSLHPGQGSYGSRVHVDSPRFIPGYRTNLGYILALHPFTIENGGTWVLPGSHLNDHIPDMSKFEQNAIQLTCERGDAIFFDGRLVHRAGENRTDEWRHAITINFCRPFMRSRFDFPRMLSQEAWVNDLDASARKFLGFDVRMPTSLSEFYLPPSERLYLPNQE